MLKSKVPNSKLEFRFKISNVPNKSLVLNVSNKTKYGFYKIFSTEERKSKDNTVKFEKGYITDYRMEDIVYIKFDCDYAFLETTLGDILSRANNKIATFDLSKGGMFGGQLEITIDEMPYINDEIYTSIKGIDLDSKDLNGKSDPYLKIYKIDKNTEKKQLVYQSEVQKKTLNPIFNYICLSLGEWCSNDLSKELLIKVYDWNLISKPEKIGHCKLITEELLKKPQCQFTILNKKNKSSGILVFDFFEIKKKHTMIDYLAGGCELSVTVAIDCSSSNFKKNLHSFSEKDQSKYGSALFEIANALESWPTNGFIEVLGFGGIIPETDNKSYCFPFSFNPSTSFINNSEDLFNLYYNKIQDVVPSEPSNLNEVLQYVINKTKIYSTLDQNDKQLKQKYEILLVFTDGEISDIEEIYKTLYTTPDIPISIIFIEIGAQSTNSVLYNFEHYPNYYKPNGKNELPYRNVTTHIEYRKKDNFYDLENEVMGRVPEQLTSYFINNKVFPNSPKNSKYCIPNLPF